MPNILREKSFTLKKSASRGINKNLVFWRLYFKSRESRMRNFCKYRTNQEGSDLSGYEIINLKCNFSDRVSAMWIGLTLVKLNFIWIKKKRKQYISVEIAGKTVCNLRKNVNDFFLSRFLICANLLTIRRRCCRFFPIPLTVYLYRYALDWQISILH